MSKFSVGEIAIVVNSRLAEFPNGSEVEVLAVYDPPYAGRRDLQYLIHIAAGVRIFANDRCLRKKQPPREEVGRWEDCPADVRAWRVKLERETA